MVSNDAAEKAERSKKAERHWIVFTKNSYEHFMIISELRCHELFPNETILNLKIPNVKIPIWASKLCKIPIHKNPEFSLFREAALPFPLTQLTVFLPSPAKLGEGKKAFLSSPSLAGEGERGNATSRNTIHAINTTAIRNFYIQDFATNPDSGFLHSGLFHSGKVRGACQRSQCFRTTFCS